MRDKNRSVGITKSKGQHNLHLPLNLKRRVATNINPERSATHLTNLDSRCLPIDDEKPPYTGPGERYFSSMNRRVVPNLVRAAVVKCGFDSGWCPIDDTFEP